MHDPRRRLIACGHCPNACMHALCQGAHRTHAWLLCHHMQNYFLINHNWFVNFILCQTQQKEPSSWNTKTWTNMLPKTCSSPWKNTCSSWNINAPATANTVAVVWKRPQLCLRSMRSFENTVAVVCKHNCGRLNIATRCAGLSSCNLHLIANLHLIM